MKLWAAGTCCTDVTSRCRSRSREDDQSSRKKQSRPGTLLEKIHRLSDSHGASRRT